MTLRNYKVIISLSRFVFQTIGADSTNVFKLPQVLQCFSFVVKSITIDVIEAEEDSEDDYQGPQSFKKAGSESSAPDAKFVKVGPCLALF